MYAIAKKEFLQLFKSLKSMIIIALLFVISYYNVKFADWLVENLQLTDKEASIVHMTGLFILIGFMGQLLTMILSHDAMSREMDKRTIRFLITRTSRMHILLGKFVGIWLYWCICFSAAYFLISIYSNQIDMFIYAQTVALIAFQTALTLFMSVLVDKPGMSLLIGILLGITLPIIGLWIAETTAWYGIFKWINPYYYLLREDMTFLVVVIEAACLWGAAYGLFRRRAC